MSRANKRFLDHAWPQFPFCQWCLLPLKREEATADHIRAKSRGGKEWWSNKLVCCNSCNRDKRNKNYVNPSGVWISEQIPKPHGPKWTESKKIKVLNSPRYWCFCHLLSKDQAMIGVAYVSTETLKKVVREAPASEEAKDLTIKRLESSIAQGEETDCFYLGLIQREIYDQNPHLKEDLKKIMDHCRDMNKLPLVRLNGEPVDGTKIRFRKEHIPIEKILGE